MSYQERLSPKSALFSKAARRKLGQRDHLQMVEKLAARQNAAPARDERREALAAAIARVGEVEKELQVVRLAAEKKMRESWDASRAIEAAKGVSPEVAMAAMNDYNAAAKQQARDAEKRYLEDAEARHAQWVVDRELGRSVGEEPPTVEQIEAKVKAAQARVAEIDAIRARLEAEVRQREGDVAHAKNKVKEAVGKVLVPSFREFVDYYRAQQDRLAILKENGLLLGRLVEYSPEYQHWSSLIVDAPSNCTAELKAEIDKLSADADADVSAAIDALKMGAPERREVPSRDNGDAPRRSDGLKVNRYGGRIR